MNQRATQELILGPRLMASTLPPDLKAAVVLVASGLANRVVLVGFPLPPELREAPYRLVVDEVQIEAEFSPYPEEPCALVVSRYTPAEIVNQMPVKLHARFATS
jgi:hypothetical protein